MIIYTNKQNKGKLSSTCNDCKNYRKSNKILAMIETMRTQNKISVPFDLIPVDSKQLDETWATKTFQYAYCFSGDITTKIINNTEDLQTWIGIASDIQLELRAIGLQQAHAKIVDVFRDYGVYLQTSSSCKQHPVNFDDIISIISNVNWYKTRQISKQALIHMVTYRIFRKGYNTWAIEAANKWLHTRNLKLTQGKRRGKGFVYCNFALRASNSIADRIQKCMLACHGEYIGVRQKNSQHEFKKINLNHFEAYIVKPHDMIAEIMSTEEKHVRNIRNAIALGMKNGVTQSHVRDILDTMNWGK